MMWPRRQRPIGVSNLCAMLPPALIIHDEEFGLLLVYLIRHAIAEERNPHEESNDAARRLTDRGVDRMKRNVAALAALGVELDAVWTSPLVRTRETAELLTGILKGGGRIDIDEDLAPGGDHGALFARLAVSGIPDAVAFVGHEPDMGEIASRLMFGDSSGALAFKKGGVACIEVDDGFDSPAGVLHWMLTPKQMRAMAPSSKVV